MERVICGSRDDAVHLRDVVISANDVLKGIDAEDEVRAILKCLDRRKRRIVLLYVIRGECMKKIAQRMHVSESRICQLYAEAGERLRQEVSRRRRV